MSLSEYLLITIIHHNYITVTFPKIEYDDDVSESRNQIETGLKLRNCGFCGNVEVI